MRIIFFSLNLEVFRNIILLTLDLFGRENTLTNFIIVSRDTNSWITRRIRTDGLHPEHVMVFSYFFSSVDQERDRTWGHRISSGETQYATKLWKAGNEKSNILYLICCKNVNSLFMRVLLVFLYFIWCRTNISNIRTIETNAGVVINACKEN